MKNIAILLLFIIAGCGAYFVYENEKTKRAAQAEANYAIERARFEQAAEQASVNRMESAIKEGKVILGMSRDDMIRSVGQPDAITRKDGLEQEMLRIGIVEIWFYNLPNKKNRVILINKLGEVSQIEEI